jgi:predicted DNA-binding ribbon-helix-helix protein
MEKVANYEQDFLTWTQQQAEYLQKGRWTELDVKNLIEELEALGRSEQKELSSYFQVLVMHLLKCQYQPEKRTPSWNNTLSNCRDKIQDCLEDTPSLQRFLQDSEWIEKYYRRARRDAAKETQKSLQTFPTECPYMIAQILDPEFLS